jgi:hypothetical protein
VPARPAHDRLNDVTLPIHSYAADTKKSLLLNGFARFPLTALHVLLGVVMYAVYHNSPELMSQVTNDSPDRTTWCHSLFCFTSLKVCEP